MSKEMNELDHYQVHPYVINTQASKWLLTEGKINLPEVKLELRQLDNLSCSTLLSIASIIELGPWHGELVDLQE